MMGSKMYPEGTNLLSPYSPIFRKDQRKWRFDAFVYLRDDDDIITFSTGLGILVSDIALIAMGTILVFFGFRYGWTSVIAFYFVPYMVRLSLIGGSHGILTHRPCSYATIG